MVDVAEAADPTERLQALLLAATGRVDDDAVNSAREMIGTGQVMAATELLVGSLLAGQIPVSAREQVEVRRLLEESRSEPAWADRLKVVESLPAGSHRFSEQNRPDSDIAEALQPITQRLSGVRGVWCVWRVTPAGVTYGAVPRRIVLAEVGQDGSVGAAGYQLLEALRRAGIGCSVDVFRSGTDLPDYHRNALAAARRVYVDLPQGQTHGSANHGRAPRAARSAGEPASSAGVSGLPAETTGAPPPTREPVIDPPAVTRPAEPAAPATPSAGAVPVTDVEETGIVLSEPITDDTPPPVQKPRAAKAPEPAPEPELPAESTGSNAKVPAAVDAKLTDRERNLLRKLHEELAQREKDRSVPVGGQKAQRSQENWTSTMPGTATGGFPPIGKNGEARQS